MGRVRSSQPALEGIIPYDPKYLPADVILSVNENPLPLPNKVEQEIIEGLRGFTFNRYPDPLANELRDLIAQREDCGLTRENVLIGNAGDELLFDFSLAWGGPGRKLLNVVPTFSVYAANSQLTGTQVVNVPRKADYTLDEEAILSRVAQGDIDQVVITSPNNPTGDVASEEFIVRLLDATDALVMLDEAYIEFADHSLAPLINQHENLLILRTFSKAYSCAGVRLGYILAQPTVIREFIKVRQPYSVDAVSQHIGRCVVRNTAAFQPVIAMLKEQRAALFAELATIPQIIDLYPSEANFILVRMSDAGTVWEKLYDRGILVRDFSHSAGLENCLRLTVGTAQENRILLDALREILAQ